MGGKNKAAAKHRKKKKALKLRKKQEVEAAMEATATDAVEIIPKPEPEPKVIVRSVESVDAKAPTLSTTKKDEVSDSDSEHSVYDVLEDIVAKEGQEQTSYSEPTVRIVAMLGQCAPLLEAAVMLDPEELAQLYSEHRLAAHEVAIQVGNKLGKQSRQTANQPGRLVVDENIVGRLDEVVAGLILEGDELPSKNTELTEVIQLAAKAYLEVDGRWTKFATELNTARPWGQIIVHQHRVEKTRPPKKDVVDFIALVKAAEQKKPTYLSLLREHEIVRKRLEDLQKEWLGLRDRPAQIARSLTLVRACADLLGVELPAESKERISTAVQKLRQRQTPTDTSTLVVSPKQADCPAKIRDHFSGLVKLHALAAKKAGHRPKGAKNRYDLFVDIPTTQETFRRLMLIAFCQVASTGRRGRTIDIISGILVDGKLLRQHDAETSAIFTLRDDLGVLFEKTTLGSFVLYTPNDACYELVQTLLDLCRDPEHLHVSIDQGQRALEEKRRLHRVAKKR